MKALILSATYLTGLLLSGCGSDSKNESTLPRTENSQNIPNQDQSPKNQEDVAENPSTWLRLGDMKQARFFHTATLLQSGDVLIVGGETSVGTPTASVEIFDPIQNTFRSLQPLPEPRSHHIAARLPSGKVLLAGGGKSSGNGRSYPSADVTASALLFDPSTESFKATDSMNIARSFAEAAPLANGEILVTGGGGGSYEGGNSLLADALSSAEIYGLDGQWRLVGSMKTPRYFHTMNVLASGAVFVVGGANESNQSFTSVERFEPVTETFVSQSPLQLSDRFRHASVTLNDNRIMVAGGKKANVKFLGSVEVYDDSSQLWTAAPPLPGGGNGTTLTLLPTGDVLCTGGFIYPNTFNDALIFDKETQTWAAIAGLEVARTMHVATLVNDGRVIITGGMGPTGSALSLAEATSP